MARASDEQILHVVDYLNRCQQNALTGGLTLVGARTGYFYPAHKKILSFSSGYFREVFQIQEREENFQPIHVTEIEEDALVRCIDYFYTGFVDVNERNFHRILQAACILKIEEIKERCIDFVITSMTPSLCLHFNMNLDFYGSKRLADATECYALTHLDLLISNDEFKLQDVKSVLRLLKMKRIRIIPETAVYESVIRWTKHDLETRRGHLADVMRCVKLHLLPLEYLKAQVHPEPLVMKNKESRELFQDALFSYMNEKVVIHKGPGPTARERMILMGLGSRNVKVFDPWNGKWNDMTSHDDMSGNFAVVAIEKKLFVLGEDRTVFKLDTTEIEPKWVEMAEMGEERGHPRAEVIGGRIYVSGGSITATGKALRTAERFDTNKNLWEKLPSMKKPRSKHCLVALGDFLYAIGGLNNTSVAVKLVERLDLNTSNWNNVAPLKQPRSGAVAVAKEGCIYIVGGNPGPDITVEVMKKSVWVSITLDIPRSIVGACVVSNDLYVLSKIENKYQIFEIDTDGKNNVVVETVENMENVEQLAVMKC